MKSPNKKTTRFIGMTINIGEEPPEVSRLPSGKIHIYFAERKIGLVFDPAEFNQLYETLQRFVEGL